MEPITTAAIVTLAFSKFFEKGFEKLSEAALEKCDRLREIIWNKLRGNPNAEKALTAVEQRSTSEIETVADYLRVAMREDETFANDVNTLAREIINIGNIQGETWNVSGGEVNYSKDNKSPVIQGGSGHSISITYNTPPT